MLKPTEHVRCIWLSPPPLGAMSTASRLAPPHALTMSVSWCSRARAGGRAGSDVGVVREDRGDASGGVGARHAAHAGAAVVELWRGGRRDGSAGGGGVRADVPLVGWEGGYALGEVADGMVMGFGGDLSGLVGEGKIGRAHV